MCSGQHSKNDNHISSGFHSDIFALVSTATPYSLTSTFESLKGTCCHSFPGCTEKNQTDASSCSFEKLKLTINTARNRNLEYQNLNYCRNKVTRKAYRKTRYKNTEIGSLHDEPVTQKGLSCRHQVFHVYDRVHCTQTTGGIQASSCFILWRFYLVNKK